MVRLMSRHHKTHNAPSDVCRPPIWGLLWACLKGGQYKVFFLNHVCVYGRWKFFLWHPASINQFVLNHIKMIIYFEKCYISAVVHQAVIQIMSPNRHQAIADCYWRYWFVHYDTQLWHFSHHSTHWGWVTHICICNLTPIGSDNGLTPGRCQAIILTNAGILLIGPLGTNFSEILI